MRILWITNGCIPVIANELGIKSGVFEGWNILPAKLLAKNKEVEFAIASPAPLKTKTFVKIEIEGITAYCFPNNYGSQKRKMIQIWNLIEKDFKPDIVHVQGTEMPHGMFYVDACGNEKVVASIQGLTSVYERYFYGGIDFLDILKNVSLYDLYSSNSIFAGRKRCQKSGKFEIKNISNLKHIIGRTKWDEVHAKCINPNIHYYFCNETLRPSFYLSKKWQYENCEPHTIFLSQCKYPIKALHMMLKAMTIILKEYPDAKIYIGSCLRIMPKNILYRMAPTNYGGYLYKMIKKLNIEKHICFLGELDEKRMTEAYLKANVFVSPSSIENSPNSLCEAQLLGVPSVSSMVGGVEDLTRNGLTTFCYRFEEYEMLAYYVKKIFANDYDANRFKLAMQDAQIRHNPVSNIEKLLGIYARILKSKK